MKPKENGLYPLVLSKKAAAPETEFHAFYRKACVVEFLFPLCCKGCFCSVVDTSQPESSGYKCF